MTPIDRSLPFVDTHVHLWELDRFRYGWLEDPGTEAHNALLGDYRLVRSTIGRPERLLREFYGQNVTKCVHIEADYGGPDPVEETAWLEQVSQAHCRPDAIVAFCDLHQGDVAAQLDRHLAASPRLRGVRLRQHPAHPDTVAFRRGLVALEERGLSYELNASPGDLLAGRDTARAHPHLQVIVGHAGFPLQRDAEYFGRWKAEMAALAELENVACKISGLGMADHRWTIASLRPWILHCLDVFGVERSMFGTDWPLDILFGTYMEQVDAYRAILADAGFSREEQAGLLAGNAERIYRI